MSDSQTKLDLTVITDPKHGFAKLAQQPSRETVEAYFRDDYYGAIERGEKAVDIKRAMEGGDAASHQARWMSETLYADIATILRDHAPGNRVLEIGCGLGDLLVDLKARDFDVAGVEIAPPAAEQARARGLTVHEGAFETLLETELKNAAFDAVIFVNVLEQMPDPESALRAAETLLAPGGIVFVRSGNDFNPLQNALSEQVGHGDYWVVPDHIYYFNFDSLEALLRDCGLNPVHRQGDFPMELLALLGHDFVADPSCGKDAQERRVNFEMTVPAETRRRLYRALGEAGLGRCLMIAARKAG